MKAVVSKFLGIERVVTDTEIEKSENISDVSMHMQNIRRLNAVLTKTCKKCNSVKPPASHHCGVCQRCIARMDHHCPWVNNCVGFKN